MRLRAASGRHDSTSFPNLRAGQLRSADATRLLLHIRAATTLLNRLGNYAGTHHLVNDLISLALIEFQVHGIAQTLSPPAKQAKPTLLNPFVETCSELRRYSHKSGDHCCCCSVQNKRGSDFAIWSCSQKDKPCCVRHLHLSGAAKQQTPSQLSLTGNNSPLHVQVHDG